MAETKESGRGWSGLLEPASSAASGRLFSVDAVRRDFPILGTMVRGRPLVYLDNAATSQKPQAVIDAIRGKRELIWVPGPLRVVMSGLRHVPRPVFRKLPL